MKALSPLESNLWVARLLKVYDSPDGLDGALDDASRFVAALRAERGTVDFEFEVAQVRAAMISEVRKPSLPPPAKVVK